MRNSIIRGLTGSAVILLVALVFVLALLGYKALVPAQIERNTSNITRDQYAEAFAKWDSQNIGAYEVTIVDPKQEIRLRVDKRTDQLFLLSHTVLGLSESVDGLKVPLSGVTLRTFQPYTIDAIFDTIQQDVVNALSDPDLPADGVTTRYIDLHVAFDPTIGYPIHTTESLRTTLGTKEITWRTTSKDVEIKDFTVIP
jgi:hypothetical protein